MLKKITFLFLLTGMIATAQEYQDHYIKGIQNMDEAKYNDAISEFSKALDKNDNFAEGYLKRGLCFVILNDNQAALFDLNKSLQLNPKNPIAYYNRGLIEKDNGNYDDAINDFTSALSYSENFGLAYFNRALCKLALSDFENACTDISMAAGLGVENAAEIYKYTCKKP